METTSSSLCMTLGMAMYYVCSLTPHLACSMMGMTVLMISPEIVVIDINQQLVEVIF